LPDDGGLVLARPVEVAIDAVVADVELAAVEPARVRLVPGEDPVPALEPVQRLRLLGPEALRVVPGALPEPLVLRQALDVGAGRELGRRRELAGLLEDAGDVRGRRRGHNESP